MIIWYHLRNAIKPSVITLSFLRSTASAVEHHINKFMRRTNIVIIADIIYTHLV